MPGMASDLPQRPALADHVLVRRHVIDGQTRVVLHDQQRRDVVVLGEREWAIVEACDGTREPEGVVVAARRGGGFARVEAVRQMLASLHARGMLVAGAGPDEALAVDSAPEALTTHDAARPLVAAQPGLRCDGGGTCCRLYGTVMLSDQEAARARLALPGWTIGEVPIERLTTPLRGSLPGPRRAMTARDGACGLLQPDGLCAVHRAAGAEAKPLGCRLYPRVFVDDGESIVVALRPECPCVLDPRPHAQAEPLVDDDWIREGLPGAVRVDTLPDSIELAPGRWAPRAQVRAWHRAGRAAPPPGDVARALWSLATRVDTDGMQAAVADEAPAVFVDSVAPWIEALHGQATRVAKRHAKWRSAKDLIRVASSGLATVTAVLCDRDALAEALRTPPPAELAVQEQRYWSMGWSSYRWVGGAALATALRDEAVRVWVARCLPMVLARKNPDLRAPLALVEALLRAHGVGAYTDDI